MKWIQNIAIGFTVSFLGSLPLGFLNIVGLEVYSKLGLESLMLYILGTIAVEVFVVYYTLVFANQLVKNKRLIKLIEIFGIFFLLFLAFLFYIKSSSTLESSNYLDAYLQWPIFLVGVFLCCLNFLQIPFWLAWNLYFLNGKYISAHKRLKFYYVFGTMIGVFFGMLFIIYALDQVYKQLSFFTNYLMNVIIPIFFLVLAIMQLHKVYRKYFCIQIDVEDNEVK